jgi:Spy/CpxP family protein refolding chaperone
MIRRSVVMLAMLALAGTAFAQTPASSPPHWQAHHGWKDAAQWRQKMEQRQMERLTVLLDLTPAQRRQVETIFADERAKMRTAMEQVRQAMKQARAAHEAVRKDAQQRLAGVLSATQMRKLKLLMPDRGMMMHAMMMHGMMMHGRGHGMGHGMKTGAPPGAGSGPQ